VAAARPSTYLPPVKTPKLQSTAQRRSRCEAGLDCCGLFYLYNRTVLSIDEYYDPEWPPSALEMNHNHLWRNTNSPAANKGVEMDWMGFFCALTMESTSESVPMSDLPPSWGSIPGRSFAGSGS
jgi:hypothetical protein